MNKASLVQAIIEQLNCDYLSLLHAAQTAHLAATDPENSPDNKYETLALESSYIAQGQANRAVEIRLALDLYRQLSLRHFNNNDCVYMTALVDIESTNGCRRRLFLGPAAGGLKIVIENSTVVVMTPDSPLGRGLLGKEVGDRIEIIVDNVSTEYELLSLS